MKYKFHHDAGHGWLEVSTEELRKLGIEEKISGFSYISEDRKTAYLEEDCDFAVFADAIGGKSFLDIVGEHCYQEISFIRGLEKYSNPFQKAK